MATMKDVAKRANVSVATVSSVINQNKYVSPELKERVLKAIEELNYTPNAVARSLKKNVTNSIGVILADILNPYYLEMVKGIDDVALEHDFNLILCNTSNDWKRFRTYLNLMIEKRVDGLLLANISDAEDLREVERSGIPFLLINRKPGGYAGDYVCIDNFKSSVLSVQHLYEHQYRKISFFGGDPAISTARERKEGFLAAMEQLGLTVYEDLVFSGNYTRDKGYELAKRLVERGFRSLPEAICSSSDLMAFGAYKAFKEHGIRVPEDIAIIGNANSVFSEDFSVPLTTVSHPTYEMGRVGMTMLLDKIKNPTAAEKVQMEIEPTLIVRRSCGCAWK